MPDQRFWEIDFLRGIAIIMMIIFHTIYDLSALANYPINIQSGLWFYLGKTCAILFLLLVGISLSISSSKNKKYSKNLKRGLKILFYALIITIITWLYNKEEYIRFGILHLIGFSIIIAYPSLKIKKWLNILIGISVIIIGIIIDKYYFDFKSLLILGFKYHGFSSVDYYPIFPWFGVILIGIFLGKSLYSNKKRNFKIIDLSNNTIIKIFNYLGKNSLLIYLIHQPIILPILKIITII